MMKSLINIISRDRKAQVLLAFFVVSWIWLFQVDVGHMASNAFVSYMVLFFAFAAVVLVSFVIAYWSMNRLTRLLKKPSWKSVLILASCWALTELIIAWIISVMWVGSGTSWDDMLPFGSLSPILMHTPFRFLARLFGYFGTSAVVGTGIVILLAGKKWRMIAFYYWVGLLIATMLLFNFYRTPSGTAQTVTIVSEGLQTKVTVPTEETDFILIPEYGLDDYDDPQATLLRFTEDSTSDIPFSGTKQATTSGGTTNILQYGSTNQGIVQEYEKSRLILAGEYLPFGLETALKIFLPNVYEEFRFQRSVVKGNDHIKPYVASNELIVGNGACSNIINPNDYRKLTGQNANLLANSASLEIFSSSRIFETHHNGLARFMATANARPFFQSANDWDAFAIDHNGNELLRISPESTARVNIRTNDRLTPYTLFGEWLAFIGFIIAASYGLKRYWRRPPTK